MATAQEYHDKLEKLTNEIGSTSYDIGTVQEAKAALADVRIRQKELRQVKRDINFDLKQIRTEYKAKAETAGSGGSLLFSVLGSRGSARSHRASARRGVRAERDRMLKPYEQAKSVIDELILALDKAKLQIQNFIDEEKAR
ncbi:MAG: hypothetical protein ACK2UC_01595 [Anaerolineae bacterium]|jgi:hypothetical protein